MKLLYIISTLKRSGPINQLYNLIKYLDPSWFDLHLITLSPELPDSRWSEFETLGVKLHRLNFSRLKGIFFAKQALKKMILRILPDVIHTQGFRPDMLMAKTNLCIPRLATLHNFPQFDYPMSYGNQLGNLLALLHVKGLSLFDQVIGVSESVVINLRDNFGFSGAIAIQNGVDTAVFFPARPLEKASLRQSLGLPLNGRIWISSGHLTELKNPLFLISVWGKYLQGTDDHLVFIGNGPLYNQCVDASKKNKNIHVLGRVKNVVDFLRASDVFVSASRAEGLPMACLEAMACGLPILLSNIPPHKEIWQLHPVIGRLFNSNSEEDFLEAMNHISLNDYGKCRQACLDLISMKLSAEKMSKKYVECYKELVKN